MRFTPFQKFPKENSGNRVPTGGQSDPLENSYRADLGFIRKSVCDLLGGQTKSANESLIFVVNFRKWTKNRLFSHVYEIIINNLLLN